MLNLNDTFWGWVETHLNDDTNKLRLKYSHIDDGFDYSAAITQIECRNRFSKKLGQTLASSPRFYFPNKLAGEQSTSDSLASYHLTLIKAGKNMIDLTAGLGIDVMHCSKCCLEAIALERDHELADALSYNITAAGCVNIKVLHCDCRDFISTYTYEKTGTAFIDPARRGKNGSRVYALSECEPDVTAMLPKLADVCERLVIKMSPMLDINHTIAQIGGCKKIIALGTAKECKELIAIKDFDDTDADTMIESVTLTENGKSIFSFTRHEELNAPTIVCSIPSEGDYFYEPYPSTMKAGASRLLASRYGLKMFHPNTRVFHAPQFQNSFPGEVFKIERVVDFASKHIKRLKSEFPIINVSARNFGMTADELRKKLGVRDGGDLRLIGVSGPKSERLMVIVKKV